MIQGEFGQKLFTMWVERPRIDPNTKMWKIVNTAIENAKRILSQKIEEEWEK